jgi:tripartite-type tricarboxylate transporter receptor subunit TctC
MGLTLNLDFPQPKHKNFAMTSLNKNFYFKFLQLIVVSFYLWKTPFLMAQDSFPSRPITLIVPLSAGSQVDIIARGLAENLSKVSNQPVIVQNREGASSIIGVDAVAKAKPDGYTLGFGPDGAFVIQPNLSTNLPYKSDDFEFICQTNSTMFLFLVGPQSPFKTVNDLVESARKSPNKINFGTGGVATSMHLLAESVASEANVKFNHVPFKNIGDLSVQTLNGTVDFTVSVPNMLMVNLNKGMRALAISGDGKVPNLPNIPLLKEMGFKQAGNASMIGLYAPKGMPAETSAWLRNTCQKAVTSTEFATTSAKTMTAVEFNNANTYSRSIIQSQKLNGELIKKINLSN